MSGMWASVAVVLTVTIGVGRAVPAALEALVAQGLAPRSPASGAATVEQEIRAALAAYWRAIETQDLETYLKLRPDLAPAERETVRRAFATGRPRPATDPVFIERIDVSDDRAEVRCRWAEPGNADRPACVIQLRRTPDGWVISAPP